MLAITIKMLNGLMATNKGNREVGSFQHNWLWTKTWEVVKASNVVHKKGCSSEHQWHNQARPTVIMEVYGQN